MTPIVDIFGDWVSEVSDNLLISLQLLDGGITGVHYMHGHPLEIVNILTEKDQTRKYKFEKYPLVALFQDFPERMMGSDNELIEVSLNVIICKSTLPEYRAATRYAKNFKPFLYPIYEELLKVVAFSGQVLTYSSRRIVHTKYDRVFWGAQGNYGNHANIGNDFLDAIEIQNLSLKIIKNKCKQV